MPPSIPVLEFPGSELPRCQRLDAPLLPAVGRPVAETRPFLDLGLIDVRREAAPRLARRLADQIDENRLVGHGPLLRNGSPSLAQFAPNCLRTPFGNASTLRQGGASPPLPDIDKMPGDGRRRRHRRRHQMGAALESLTALEIAVRGGGAALFRRQLVGVHRQTHRAARLAPFEACLYEDLVEAFGFGL